MGPSGTRTQGNAAPTEQMARVALPELHRRPEGSRFLRAAAYITRKDIPLGMGGGAYRIRTGPNSLEGCCATATPMLRIAATVGGKISQSLGIFAFFREQ